MRTTVQIDDDVLVAARQLASTEGLSLGAAISKLARAGIGQPQPLEVRNGIKLLPVTPSSRPVTMAEVNKLRDELL